MFGGYESRVYLRLTLRTSTPGRPVIPSGIALGRVLGSCGEVVLGDGRRVFGGNRREYRGAVVRRATGRTVARIAPARRAQGRKHVQCTEARDVALLSGPCLGRFGSPTHAKTTWETSLSWGSRIWWDYTQYAWSPESVGPGLCSGCRPEAD